MMKESLQRVSYLVKITVGDRAAGDMREGREYQKLSGVS